MSDPTTTPTPASRPQPVVIAGAITIAIPAIVGLLVATGVLDVTPDQADAISDAGQRIVAGVLTVFTLVVGVVATLRARAVVTPLSAPALRNGSPARLVPASSRPRPRPDTAAGYEGGAHEG